MNPIEMPSIDPRTPPPVGQSGTGYGIYVHANHDWLRSRDTTLACLVFRTFDDATAYLVAQQDVHGEVKRFEWR
jgi:hypothetical protein